MDSTNVPVMTDDYIFHCIVGWVPKTFVSSRSQRTDADTNQKPEDFMDEEVAAVIVL